jgi:hypothetical protein
MLTFDDFTNKIISDLNKRFSEAILEGNYIIVKSGPASMSIPISSMYREYQEVIAYFGHIRTLIPGTSGRCFGIIRTAFRLIRTPCRVN